MENWAKNFKDNVLQQDSISQDLAEVGQYNHDLTNTYWQKIIPVVTINAYLPDKVFNLVNFSGQDDEILPHYEPNIYYLKEDNNYNLITSIAAPDNWGNGEFYTKDDVPNTSFFGFIMENCDFKKPEFEPYEYPDEKIIPTILDEESNVIYNYWNPSINNLFTVFDEYFNKDEDFGNLKTKELFNSIEDANAAVKIVYLYKDDELVEYVKPFKNLSQEIYPSQRGGSLEPNNPNKGWDQTHHGLDSYWDWDSLEPEDDSRAKNLQFTARHPLTKINNQNLHYWLRLIMPKYSRHVEIEDLDRNFWVIGQVLDKLLDFLFGETNPYIKPLQGILNELAQLWENVLHLWLDLSLINQKEKYDDIHMEFIPLPSNSLRPYVKFDDIENFDYPREESLKQLINYILKGYNNTEDKRQYYETIKNRLENEYVIDEVTYPPVHQVLVRRLKYLEAKYSNQRLCVIPYIRLNNYEGNAFSTIFIPAIYWYNYSQTGTYGLHWKATTLMYSNDNWEDDIGTVSKPLIIDILGRYGSRPYLDYLYGIKELDGGYCMTGSPFYNFDVSEQSFYYGLLRFIPKINFNEQEKTVSFQLSLQDAGKYSRNKQEKELGKFIFNNSINEDQTISIGTYEDGAGAEVDIQSEQMSQQESGFYLGELLSSHEKFFPPIENDVDVSILKIGDFLPIENTMGNDILIPFHSAAKLVTKQSDFNNMGVGLKSAISSNIIYPVINGVVFKKGQGQGQLSSLGYYICIESTHPSFSEKVYYFYGNLNPTFYPINEGQVVTEDTPIGIPNNNLCYFCLATYDEDSRLFYFENISTYAKIPNYYGTYAKDDYNFIPNNYVDSEGKSKPGEFDTLTYGIGSYRFNENTGVAQYRKKYVDKILNSNIIPNTDDITSSYIRGHQVGDAQYISEGMLKFVRYKLKELKNKNDEIYYNANKTDFSSYKVDEIKMSDLEKWGIEYAKQQIELKGLQDRDQLFVTKIGINYWTGTLMSDNQSVGAAPQWNYGITCHLLHYDSESKEVISLGELSLFDGYWTQNTTVFTRPNGGTQWRRLGFRAKVKKITRRRGTQKYFEYKVTDGYLIWYDHNVAQDITGTSDRERVRIPIILEIGKDGVHRFVRDESRSVIIDSQISYTNPEEWNNYSSPIEMAMAAMRMVNTSNNSPFIVANHYVRLTGDRQSLRQPEYNYNKGIVQLNEVSDNIPNPIEKLGSGGGTECYEYSYERDKTEIDTSEGYWNNHSIWDIDT